MSFKLRNVFAALAMSFGAGAQSLQAALSIGPKQPPKAAVAGDYTGSGAIRRPASRKTAAANKRKNAKRTATARRHNGYRAKGSASRHA